MPLFPVRRASIGLSLTAQAITAVELAPRLWPLRRRRVRTLKRQDLADKLIRPSTDENNISEVSALARNLTSLVGPRPGTSVALSLPNQCAQITLLDFDVLPEHPSEREALIRWRLEKDLPLSAADCRVAYRVFGPFGNDTNPDGPKHRMLVATIRNSVLAQYEQACEQAGLLPVEVGLQGLQLFDLTRGMVRREDEWFFASVLDEQFFFVAIRHATPFLLRSKSIPNDFSCQQLELMASVQYYDELCAAMGATPQTSPRSLYLLQDDLEQSAEGKDLTIENHSSPALDTSLTDSLRINLCILKKDFLPIAWPASDIPWTAGLPALASLATQ